MKHVIAIVALSACSVPALSLDGKQCPCVEEGFTCDVDTNRCLPINDGGMIIDSPAATQCLPAANETEVYRYAGTFDWQTSSSSWSGADVIMQTSSMAMNSYAYTASAALTNIHDYHIISSMRQNTGGTGTPGLGIVLRLHEDQQGETYYSCTWIPKSRELRIESHGNNGTTLGSMVVPGMDELPTSFTMEASVQGSTLACCIRDIGPARISSATDTANVSPMGSPGVITNRMAASFDSFIVLKKN